MECFHHEGVPAVGACRACFRGVCRQCASEQEGGLACRGRCEPLVATLFATVQQAARYQNVSTGILRSARGLWVGLACVAGAVGLFVAVWGLGLPYYREIALLAIPFLALAFLAVRLARNVSGKSAA